MGTGCLLLGCHMGDEANLINGASGSVRTLWAACNTQKGKVIGQRHLSDVHGKRGEGSPSESCDWRQPHKKCRIADAGPAPHCVCVSRRLGIDLACTYLTSSFAGLTPKPLARRDSRSRCVLVSLSIVSHTYLQLFYDLAVWANACTRTVRCCGCHLYAPSLASFVRLATQR